MKKTKLILALALSAMVINSAYASEEMTETKEETTMEETQMVEEKVSDNFIIKKINEEAVEVYRKSNPEDVYTVPKKEFGDIKIKEGMEVVIVSSNMAFYSFPAKFGKIYEIKEVKKEENEDNKEEKFVRDFVVKEIYEEGVDLYELGNESNVYNVPKSEFKDIKLIKDMIFTITSDTTATKSYPAQFGKIYSIVEKKEQPLKTMVKSYVVEKVDEEAVTVYEKDMKESKYTIAKKDFGKAMPKVGETYKIETSEEILTSEPAQFAKVIKVELEKEAPKEEKKPSEKDKKPGKEKEKPVEKDKKEQMISDIFVVEKIDEEGVTVARKSNKEDKYLVPKKDFGKLMIKEGMEYKIYTNDVVLTSYPAQFGKIFKIEEVMKEAPKEKDNKKDNKKENKKENKMGAKNPKTGLIGTSMTLMALGAASLAYKKTKE